MNNEPIKSDLISAYFSAWTWGLFGVGYAWFICLAYTSATINSAEEYGVAMFNFLCMFWSFYQAWKSDTFTNLYLLDNHELQIVMGGINGNAVWCGPRSDVTRLIHQFIGEEYEGHLVEIRNVGVIELRSWNLKKLSKFGEYVGVAIEHLEQPLTPLVRVTRSELKDKGLCLI